jgi:very-short-patch-repair endonuclease
MSSNVTIVEFRKAIAEALAEEKSYDLPEVCTAFGLEAGTPEEAFSSKRSYVRNRIITKTLSELVDLSERLLRRYPDHKELSEIVHIFKARCGGVSGDIKNLIFAADGPKPELVLADALNNTIEIVENSEYCLIYNLPILQSGLLWQNLVEWWARANNLAFPARNTEVNLFTRLRSSLASPPERLFFDSYFKFYHDVLGESFPALVPQVYLHFDPKSLKDLEGQQRLPRQRMDFLILLSNNQRIVIEIDGKQHYSENDNVPSPRKYSEMVAEDRRLRLLGYEVYRFGGYELKDDNSNKAQSENLVQNFFLQLFEKYRIMPISET